MNKKYFSLFLLICLSSFCYGIVLPEGTDARISDISFSNDKISSVVLSVPTELNTSLGKIEAFGTVKFFESGLVEEITPFAEGVLDTPVGKLSFSADEAINFYESGALKNITLEEHAVLIINGESYKSMSGFFALYDEWRPSGFELFESKKMKFEFGEVVFKRGSSIFFNAAGSILNFQLNQQTEINTSAGKVIADGYISLWDSQTLKSVNVIKSDGLDTKYGKVFPVEKTQVIFSEKGIITEVTPQDIMICSIGTSNFMTQSGERLIFDGEGNIKAGIIKNSKIKYKDWDIVFYGENNQFVIYDGFKLYIPYGLISEINGYSFSKQTMRFLFTDDSYYFWTTEPLEYPRATSIHEISKSKPFANKVLKTIKDDAISHFNKDGKDINIENCPLIMNEEGKVIGYRKSDADDDYDYYWKSRSYDRIKDEYVNYIEDVYFK